MDAAFSTRSLIAFFGASDAVRQRSRKAFLGLGVALGWAIQFGVFGFNVVSTYIYNILTGYKSLPYCWLVLQL